MALTTKAGTHNIGLVPATSPCNKSQGLVPSCVLTIKFSVSALYPLSVHGIYQTRETVFHLDIQTPRRECKI